MEPLQALIDAVLENDAAAVAQAIERGADPDADAGSRSRPKAVITMAAEQGAAGVVEVLLDAGAAISPEAGWDWVPLRAAVYYGHADVVRLLLERGADPNTSHERASMLVEAIDAARHRPSIGSAGVLADLLQFGSEVRDSTSRAIIHAVENSASPEVLRILIRHGESPDQVRPDGVPLLVLATRRRDVAAVDVLLSSGAEPDATDGQGRTALMHAAELGFERILRALLLAGADRECVDAHGSTALALAKGWQRMRIQFTMGENSAQHGPTDIQRTFMELVPQDYELRGSVGQFELWSRLVDHTVDDLGDEEFRTLVGFDPVDARLLAEKLRGEPCLAADRDLARSPGLWHELRVTLQEIGLVRACLLNLAYGPAMSMPAGLSPADVADLSEELLARLDR